MPMYTINSGGEQLSKLSMNLFGMPYQFTDAVDPRINGISKEIGKNFMEKIVTEAPVLTLIPGKPKYLSAQSETEQRNTTAALLEAALQGNSQSITQLIDDNKGEDMRLYDFQRDYTAYYQYVNVLCRTGAAFLGITDTITVPGTGEVSFEKFDWQQYRWNSNAVRTGLDSLQEGVSTVSSIGKKPTKPSTKGMTKKQKKAANKKYKKELAKWKKENKNVDIKSYDERESAEDVVPTSYGISFETDDTGEGDITDDYNSYYYVQFYIDPETGSSETMSNSTGESSIKGLFDGAGNTLKDFAFMANSGGMDASNIEKMASGAVSGVQEAVNKILPDGGIQSVFDRLANLSDRVIKGENIIIPDIYQSSSYEKSYSVTVHLKTPYGTKMGYYMDIFVPLMHLLALSLPKQGSANSYGAPFLVKGFVEGLWTINLGIVTDISITKDVESLNTDGLPTSVDVVLTIRDLYSDISLSPSNSPRLFINNASLIEYLAVSCGLSLTRANFEARVKMVVDTMTSAFTDIPTTVKSTVDETIDNWISSSLSLIN